MFLSSFLSFGVVVLARQGGAFTIALFRLLTRCAAPLTATCPVVHGRALLSARSPHVASAVPRMPQTNKSRNVPASESSGSVQGEAHPVSRQECTAARDAGGGEDNVGDGEIIKSPSDPKQYRYFDQAL